MACVKQSWRRLKRNAPSKKAKRETGGRGQNPRSWWRKTELKKINLPKAKKWRKAKPGSEKAGSDGSGSGGSGMTK
jgi:hypothetical protein